MRRQRLILWPPRPEREGNAVVNDDLTNGEYLWLWMRRLDHTRASAAKLFGVPPKTITAWTRDRPAPGGATAPAMEVAQIWDHECISIARRRRGWSLREAARRMGMSHVTLINRERGGGEVGALIAWWEGEGWPPATGEGEVRRG